jgi:hypothetical protein
MGKQYNKLVKARRRTEYLKRKKAAVAAKLKPKARAKAAKKAEAAPEAPAAS